LDIKIISGIVGVVFTFGALFVQVGEVLNRLSALESKSAPDTTIIEQDVTTLKSVRPELSIIELLFVIIVSYIIVKKLFS
jgi:hypothetical protein